ncbi:Fungalysin metallopeptidase-domain-containing protein [Armillaria luteobubalina]|uniref:Extracellular metalloproteinase n=1 Tax=Armillaria luteobubalina TaxID=153913 RepID=A0AA39PW74_9AGAR|nr:Fungalysin metallopeptidase-domain-containing protein [Armillaria luteobubalina]
MYNSGHMAENDMSYAYEKQYHDGVPFANAIANVAFKSSKAISLGSSFIDTSSIASSQPTRHPLPRVFSLTDGLVALAHVVQVLNSGANTGYEAFVDAHSGDIIAVTDFSAHARYTVVPITRASVAEGEQTLINPEDLTSSPQGWVQNGVTVNNVVSFMGSLANTTVQSSPNTFDYPYRMVLDPQLGGNVNAARTNTFYIIKKIHDYMYKYGWTEAVYNFQQNNFGKGGKGDDCVQISVQDVGRVNNANFLTRPDGQPGSCQMYIWTKSVPKHDGDVQNDVIVHEMTHGITNCLTGGGMARCLQTVESKGLGEGWSDGARWTEQKSATISDYVVAAWVKNKSAGIRHYPYSTNPNVNPLRYSSLAKLGKVHYISKVWANMLHNVYAALVKTYGWSSRAMDDATGREGNIVYLHLFTDALSLQPCNPTFVQAWAAWIQADVNRIMELMLVSFGKPSRAGDWGCLQQTMWTMLPLMNLNFCGNSTPKTRRVMVNDGADRL